MAADVLLSIISFFVLCSHTLVGVHCRSLNIVLNHNEKYSVDSRDILSYIPLDDRTERQLDLPDPYVQDQQHQQQHEWQVDDDQADYDDTLEDDEDDLEDHDDDVTDRHIHAEDIKQTSYDSDDLKDADHDDDMTNQHVHAEDIKQTGFDRDDLADSGQDDVSLEDIPDPESSMLTMKHQYIPKRRLDVLEDQLALAKKRTHRRHRRTKRAAMEQWRMKKAGRTYPGGETSDNEKPRVWEAVTDEDIKHGKQQKYFRIAEFIGITLLSVAGFVFIGICFMRDPVMCIFAFGTGCPCCLVLCPCVRTFTDKYLNTKNLVRDSMNKYMPGVIVKEDGTLDYYEPTAEEVMILHEIMEEIME